VLLVAVGQTAFVLVTDVAGDITFANQKFVEVSKYAPDELIGQNHRILSSEAARPELGGQTRAA
jgi:PAS domain S-box-containing protein